MIYSIDFEELCMKINPLAIVKYIAGTGWREIPVKKSYIRVFQIGNGEDMIQVTVPLSREFRDYKYVVFDAVNKIAAAENKTVEEVVLYLLNPNTDILKIRLDKKGMEPGNILMDDAVNLFNNAKKLISAATMDVINPLPFHIGRPDDNVTKFLNDCRFGQTEVGSYIISVICPFAEIQQDHEYRLLSFFTDEELCANSLTRKVTNRIIRNISLVKEKIDVGKENELIYDTKEGKTEGLISTNFLDALTGMGLNEEKTAVDFRVDWSPLIKNTVYQNTTVRLTNDYYEPIREVSRSLHDEVRHSRPVIGRIESLQSLPDAEKRTEGTVKIIYLDENNHKKTVRVVLGREDYIKAIRAHETGSTVRVTGEFTGKNQMDYNSFAVIE